MISNIIATVGRPDALRVHLFALCEQTYSDFQVVVADDDKSGKTVEMLLRLGELPFSVKSLWVGGKGGISRARNAGILASSGDILVFSDDDAIPCEDMLREYAAVVRPGVAAYGWVSPAHHARRPHKISDVQGCNMAVHRLDWECVGPFSEDFPGYGAEDTDYAIRLRAAGVHIEYLPSAHMIHAHQMPYANGSMTSGEKDAQLKRNYAALTEKYGPLWETATVAPLGSLVRRTA